MRTARIMINLDVVTNALWKGSNKPAALQFLKKIETFNKKHLYSKRQETNEILKKFNLKEVEINVPA